MELNNLLQVDSQTSINEGKSLEFKFMILKQRRSTLRSFSSKKSGKLQKAGKAYTRIERMKEMYERKRR
jgi:hypothetical protein